MNILHLGMQTPPFLQINAEMVEFFVFFGWYQKAIKPAVKPVLSNFV